MSEEKERILVALRRGVSPLELREELAALPDDEADDEPIECCYTQRLFIEKARERAAFMIDSPGTCFPNPKDRQTHIDIRASQEIAMAFCNVKDAQGSQLGFTVDDVATRCLNAEAASKKQSKVIEDLQDENHRLNLEVVRGKAGRP
jgi:hypothetical protein